MQGSVGRQKGKDARGRLIPCRTADLQQLLPCPLQCGSETLLAFNVVVLSALPFLAGGLLVDGQSLLLIFSMV